MSTETPTLRDQITSAEMALATGDADKAALFCANVLAKARNNSKALKVLQKLRKTHGGGQNLSQQMVNHAVAVFQSGNFPEAARLAKNLIFLSPQEPVLFNLAGMSLAMSGDNDSATAYFRTATAIRPNYPEALANLGTALLKSGAIDQAIPVLEKALKSHPNDSAALTSLGLAHYQGGNYEKALQSTEAALAANPKNADAYNSKGLILRAQLKFDEAILAYQAGLAVNGRHFELLVNLGYALIEQERDAEGLKLLEEAARINAANPDVWLRIGSNRGIRGDREGALDAFRKSLSIRPDFGETWRTLSIYKKFSAGDPDIEKMEALFTEADDAESRMHLGFALGKAYEDAGALDKAFACWKAGNTLRRERSPYDHPKDVDLFNRVKSLFSAEFFRSFSGFRDETRAPLFIVGMMRSGTTLVEQILASHSGISAIGEQPYFSDRAEAILGEMEAGLFSSLPSLARGYGELVGRLGNGQRTVDKMPVNFLWIGLIKTIFPKARFINLSREPRDVALSIYKNFFDSEGNLYAYDLEDIGRFYVLYRQMIDHWNAVLPGDIYTIRYENVTADLESECRNLLAFCGLEWEDGVMEFYKTKRSVRTASVGQVREKIYTSSVAAWRRFESELAPLDRLLNEAGY